MTCAFFLMTRKGERETSEIFLEYLMLVLLYLHFHYRIILERLR